MGETETYNQYEIKWLKLLSFVSDINEQKDQWVKLAIEDFWLVYDTGSWWNLNRYRAVVVPQDYVQLTLNQDDSKLRARYMIRDAWKKQEEWIWYELAIGYGVAYLIQLMTQVFKNNGLKQMGVRAAGGVTTALAFS